MSSLRSIVACIATACGFALSSSLARADDLEPLDFPIELRAWAPGPNAADSSYEPPGRLKRRAVCCSPAYDQCGWALDTCGKRYGRWEIQLELGASLLSSPEGLMGPATGDPAQFRWDALDYPASFGARFGVQYAFSARDRVFLRATNYGQPNDSVRQTGVFGFTPIPGAPVGTTAVNTATFKNEAEMGGLELHAWHEVCGTRNFRWEIGAGLRAIRFDETTTLDPWTPPFPGLGGAPYLRSESENSFLGGQLGLQAHYDVSCKVEIFGNAKGLLGSMRQDVTVTDRSVFSGGPHSSAAEDSAFAVGGEAEIGVRWRLSRSLLLTGSYNVLLIDGVVRSYEAFDFTQSATGAVQAVLNDDFLVAHSVYLGVVLNLGR